MTGLNDVLARGNCKILNDLNEILIRSHLGRHTLSGDISKAYNIIMDPRDYCYNLLLLPVTEEGTAVKVYVFISLM